MGEPRRPRSDVFEEEEFPAWTKHTFDLLQRHIGGVDGAENEGRDHGVDRLVLERQAFSRCIENP
jgi:hypothetical protein